MVNNFERFSLFVKRNKKKPMYKISAINKFKDNKSYILSLITYNLMQSRYFSNYSTKYEIQWLI